MITMQGGVQGAASAQPNVRPQSSGATPGDARDFETLLFNRLPAPPGNPAAAPAGIDEALAELADVSASSTEDQNNQDETAEDTPAGTERADAPHFAAVERGLQAILLSPDLRLPALRIGEESREAAKPPDTVARSTGLRPQPTSDAEPTPPRADAAPHIVAVEVETHFAVVSSPAPAEQAKPEPVGAPPESAPLQTHAMPHPDSHSLGDSGAVASIDRPLQSALSDVSLTAATGESRKSREPASHMRLVIEPAGLGEVNVNLRATTGQLDIAISSPDASVVVMLEQDRSDLASAMTDAGYVVGDLSVAQSGPPAASQDQTGASSGQRGQSGQNSAADRAPFRQDTSDRQNSGHRRQDRTHADTTEGNRRDDRGLYI